MVADEVKKANVKRQGRVEANLLPDRLAVPPI